MERMPHQRTPEEVERELARKRVDLDETLTAIEKKLSPQRFVRDTKGSLQSVAYGAQDMVRMHPVPVAIAGTLLLAGFGALGRRRWSAGDELDYDQRARLRHAIEQALARGRGGASRGARAAGRLAARGAAYQARQALRRRRNAGELLREMGSEAGDRASELMHVMGPWLARGGRRTLDELGAAGRRRPLLAEGVAAVLGMCLAAALLQSWRR